MLLAPIPLRTAPGILAPQLWSEFCQRYPTEAAALESLDSPGRQWRATMAEVDVQAGRDYDGKSAAEAAHGSTGNQIIDLIRAKLIKGELKATALQPPSLARVEIPAGLWGELRFGFARSGAQSNTDGYKFVGVELSANLGTTDTRTAACQAWLQGEERKLKKIMQARAQDRIAGLTTREFDAAYSAVFPSKRGRPRNENNKIIRT